MLFQDFDKLQPSLPVAEDTSCYHNELHDDARGGQLRWGGNVTPHTKPPSSLPAGGSKGRGGYATDIPSPSQRAEVDDSSGRRMEAIIISGILLPLAVGRWHSRVLVTSKGCQIVPSPHKLLSISDFMLSMAVTNSGSTTSHTATITTIQTGDVEWQGIQTSRQHLWQELATLQVPSVPGDSFPYWLHPSRWSHNHSV